MSASAAKPGWNLATRSVEDRAALNADLIACRIRWECRALKGNERQRKAQELLGVVPANAVAAVRERLKERASR
ncbi:hypothetical protein JQR85_13605 [Stutzerimonas urumqiensis]|uniref:hypothetical protein n=1 Tax=Stutzerimonas urumqiensis TaxID=638269 RepID=UPI003DA49D81